MPTYDYECDACGHKFEEFQSMKDKALKKCPQCKKQKLRRLFGTGAAVIFKGSGFYQTDYRSESYKSAAQADQQGGAAKPADDAAKPADAAAKPAADTTGTSGKADAASADTSKPADKSKKSKS